MQNLKIRPKEGDIARFQLNPAQHILHKHMEVQRKKGGKVRAIILKGRQQGCSTYIEGRYYWAVTHRKGVRAFILAHDEVSTGNLFAMAKRYYENMPMPMRPKLQTSNARELLFSDLDSGYKIGTAGNADVGRSQTLQYLHGSEVAYWKNASELTKGILQAVPDMPGTEIIYESTANGVGGFFHQQCITAMKKEGDFEFIFIPWFIQPEYRRECDDFERTDYENELRGLYKLSDEQLNWRRSKIIELSTGGSDGIKAFQQEYPCTPNEAFIITGEDGIIKARDVIRARKADNIQAIGPLIVGIDPSRGGDRFGVARRKGRVVYGVEGHTGDINQGRQVQICKKILDEEDPAMMFIDAGGGDALVDRLHELNYSRVRAIPFGGRPLNPEKYKKKRAEMWGLVSLWLTDEHQDVKLPDDDAVQADLCTPMYQRDSVDRIVLESKDAIKKRGLPSPDFGDAIALTFAEPVRDMQARRIRVKRQFNG